MKSFKKTKTVLSFILLFTLVLSFINLCGCSKETPQDVIALSKALCSFDRTDLTVNGIQRMEFPDPECNWYIYHLSVTIHQSGTDVEDTLGFFYFPDGENIPGVYSSKNDTALADSTDAGTAFYLWEKYKDKTDMTTIREYSDEETQKLVEKTWKYVEDNNIHPE